ncbi:MAG TPA: NUDIX hydrolase [Pyrinomonadaceae bacterium]|nr:NUDIX hydrolase [Pyrinomonadaceae bacterium]
MQIVGKIWKKLPQSVRLRIIRVTQPTFTVSAAAVVLNEKRQVLLLNHILRPTNGWGIPGGFLDRGEQPEDAIRRELAEETGIELNDLRMFRVRSLGRHVEILFAATSTGVPEVKSREITELGWFSPEDIPGKLSIGQKLIIEAVLAGEI